jgi:hypothetical protein
MTISFKNLNFLMVTLLIPALLGMACSAGKNAAQNAAPTPETDQPQQSPSAWVPCATENGVCLFEGTADVRYGLDGVYVTQSTTYAMTCSNAAFGADPVVGSVKNCEYNNLVAAPPEDNAGWTFCADENGVCSFIGNAEVRYGLNHMYYKQDFTDSANCNNATFGDPLVGIAKRCEYRPR